MSNDKTLNTLIDCIISAIDKKIEALKCDREGIVVSSDNDNCTVLIDNVKYTVKNGTGIVFKDGDKCLIHYINGDQRKKVIIAKMNGQAEYKTDDSDKNNIEYISHTEIDKLFK